MAMAVTAERHNTIADAQCPASRVARVQVFHDLDSVEQVWRQFETSGQLLTPFQRFDFLATWQKHVGTADHVAPFVIAGYDADRHPLLLLPLAARMEHGVRVARFLGGKHATFNMPIYRRDFATAATVSDLEALLSGVRAQRQSVDVLALERQPERWLGITNPLSLLRSQKSTNDCPLTPIAPGAPPASLISNSFRRRLKSKERKLQALPGYRYVRAGSEAEIRRILDAFFVIKPARMAAQKLPNVFADPGIEDFIREACLTPLPGGSHVIDIHALECDDEAIAIFAGVADGHRFSMMFNTYTMSDNARHSPGLILVRSIVDYYAGQGYTSLDLGIGSDSYKQLFCKESEPIFDSFLPLSTRGHLAAACMSALGHAKRAVKQTPALARAVQTLRGMAR